MEPLGGIPFGTTDGYSSGGYSSGGFLSGYRSSGLLNGGGAGDASIAKKPTPFSGNDSATSCFCHGRAQAQALEADRHISLFAGEVGTPEAPGRVSRPHRQRTLGAPQDASIAALRSPFRCYTL